MMFYFFFFNDTATTEIYTLSLHDALPISRGALDRGGDGSRGIGWNLLPVPQGSASGSVRGGVSGSGHGVRDHRADHRPHLGEADLGDLVDLGCPAHLDVIPLLPVRGVSARARGGAGSGAPRP